MTDTIEDIDRMAKQSLAEDTAKAAISKGRGLLVMGKSAESAFFASIVMSWRLRPTWGIDTMGVDGRHLFYNPDFVANLPPDELKGVLVHEAMHDAMGHHLRRGSRDHQLFNISCDLAVNPIVLQANYKLPSKRLMPGEGQFKDLPVGLSAEEYYAKMPPSIKSKCGPGNDPGGTGQTLDGQGDKSQADQHLAQEEHKMKVAQAHAHAKNQNRGTMPGWMEGMVTDTLEPKVDWRAVLRRFLTQKAKSDYAWTPPNRRFISQGFYLPSASTETIGHIVVSVDCSGSCWDKDVLSRFAGEINGILGAYQVTLSVLYNDTRVVESFEWEPGKGLLKLEPKGGGGTDHNCVTEWIAEKKITPACLVCLSDCYTSYPPAPEYPTLWAVVGNPNPDPPFGEVILVDV
jgi:predicted metal-dependent peptidase